MRSALLGALVACALLAAGPARADERDARALFDEGRAALERGRNAEARDLLRRSLEELPRTATAFNLLVALRGTAQPIEAEPICARLLEGGFGPLEGAQRDEAVGVCEALRAMAATLTVTPRGAPRVELRLDGETAGTARDGEPRRFRLDPGRHVIAARASGHRGEERAVDLPRGGAEALTLALTPAPSAEGEDMSWVPWLVAAAGLLVVGAVAVGIGVAVADGRDGRIVDPVFGNPMALGRFP